MEESDSGFGAEISYNKVALYYIFILHPYAFGTISKASSNPNVSILVICQEHICNEAVQSILECCVL